MSSLQVRLVAVFWSAVIGNAVVILVAVAILVAILRGMRMSFKDKLRARRAKEREAKRRRGWLEESVRTHLLPALVEQGFRTAPRVGPDPVGRKYAGSFPLWGRLIRAREPVVDQVEIQFSSYGRSAFRINACAVPKEGMMTAGGHKTAEECIALGVHNLETHARPWLRPGLRALGLEPLGEWFSVWHWPLRSATQTDYEKLALRVVGILPELELALREGKLGPHIRRLDSKLFRPLPPEVLERLEKLKSEGAVER